MISRPGIFIFLLIACFFWVNEAVWACMCAGVGPPCQEYWRSDAVFSGTVVSQKVIEEKEAGSDETSWKTIVHFKIEQAFKGISGEFVEVVTGISGGDCGYQFNTGKRYIVYAKLMTGGKRYWYTGICQRIMPIEKAEEDLAYFQALPKAGSGASIFGSITQVYMKLQNRDESIRNALQNIRITADSPSSHFEALTDKDGRYQITGLPPGRYKVQAELAENQDTQKEYEVDVVDRGCAKADFYVYLRGQISGLIADEHGNPIPNIVVEIISAEDAQKSAPKGKTIFTNDRGKYMLDWLPPERYYLGIGLNAQSDKCSYPRTYFPGVSQLSDAEIIDLLPGQKLENRNIIAPSFTPDLEIEVEVVWPDGTPLETGAVILHPSGHTFPITPDRATKIGPGVYRIKGFKGCGYWLKAFTYGHPGEPGGGNPWHDEVEIDPSKELTKPLRLVLTKPGFFCRHEQPK